MIVDTIHGHRVLAWAQTEIPNGNACGIVLVEIRKDESVLDDKGLGLIKGEWATAWYRQGDKEWSNGHYFRNVRSAQQDFLERSKLNGFGDPEAP